MARWMTALIMRLLRRARSHGLAVVGQTFGTRFVGLLRRLKSNVAEGMGSLRAPYRPAGGVCSKRSPPFPGARTRRARLPVGTLRSLLTKSRLSLILQGVKSV